VGNEVVHAVERAQEGGFSAARRPDQGGNLPFFDLQMNIFQGLKGPVIKIQALRFHFNLMILLAHVH
jgi:hypothetical protein